MKAPIRTSQDLGGTLLFEEQGYRRPCSHIVRCLYIKLTHSCLQSPLRSLGYECSKPEVNACCLERRTKPMTAPLAELTELSCRSHPDTHCTLHEYKGDSVRSKLGRESCCCDLWKKRDTGDPPSGRDTGSTTEHLLQQTYHNLLLPAGHDFEIFSQNSILPTGLVGLEGAHSEVCLCVVERVFNRRRESGLGPKGLYQVAHRIILASNCTRPMGGDLCLSFLLRRRGLEQNTSPLLRSYPLAIGCTSFCGRL